MNQATSLENDEAKSFLSLCRLGKLYEVEHWIADGKPIHVTDECPEKPLEIALTLGFHSLVELLLRNEESQWEKNWTLARAVQLRRLDLVELALTKGAELRSVPLTDVLLEWNPSIVRLFIEGGADPLAGAPFAIAFSEKIRTALGPFLDCIRKYPQHQAELQEQADRALRYFSSQGNLKWVSLMLWLGASPRSRGPNMHHWCDENDPESHSTAFEEACQSGHLEILKKLKPDRATDDLEKLLVYATWRSSKELVSYLLDLGAIPNDKQSGGSAALSQSLWRIQIEGFDPNGIGWRTSKWTVNKALSLIEELASRGAQWVPRHRHEVTSIRRVLLKCDPDVTLEVLSSFTKHEACSGETLRQLLGTPAMKEHLKNSDRELVRLKLKEPPPPRGAVVVKTSRLNPTKRNSVVPPGLLRKYSREKLYTEVWELPVQAVSKQYRVSDVALAKACRKLAVPLPGRGYWAKKSAGKTVPKRPPLPELTTLS